MTPQEMLRRGVPTAPLIPTPRLAPAPTITPSLLSVDHVIKVLEPPAKGGIRIKRSEAEPWILEQLNNNCCPTCSEHLLHMVCTFAPDTHFYTCEDNVLEHRWTLIEDTK